MKSLFGLNYSVQAPEKRRGVFMLMCVLFCVQISLIWPIYPLFGSIYPIVFGIPFSIVWVLI
ncbi:MAG: hypothetical protein VW868_08285, partial [Bacteroidota bacterium]